MSEKKSDKDLARDEARKGSIGDLTGETDGTLDDVEGDANKSGDLPAIDGVKNEKRRRRGGDTR